MTTDFEGRVALVTGASRNIGRSIALGFAEAGANVAVTAHTSRDEAEEVAREARAHGVESVAMAADVGDPHDVERLVREVTSELGRVDYLINNAARRPRQDLLSISIEDWNRILSSNLSSAFYLARLVLPTMVEAQFGRIIMIGGPDGQRGSSHRAHNVTAKAGIIGLTKAIAIEFGRHGVTANVVVPGITDTTRNPSDYPHWPFSQEELEQRLHIPRLGRPEEVADACVFLASPKASYITGQTLHVSGGYYMP